VRRDDPRFEEWCAKISAAKMGHPVSEETRAKLRGRRHTDEARAKMSAAKKGKKVGQRPPEVGEAISRALKGKPASERRIAANRATGESRRGKPGHPWTAAQHQRYEATIAERGTKDGHRRGPKNGQRAVYEQHHGPIPPGFVVHHVDGDGLNNDPANLVAMSRSEHARLHHKQGDIPNP
jgi:hypothetical protein